ncbi:MAG TPA: hypothetical protein PLG04_00345 [Anaerolineaceae bacterium]|nr:hypothetical protein [Anaerolineaceae bacterium]
MHSYDYEAVVYDGEIYCVDCLPEGVDIDDPEVMPIFADSEWNDVPVCSVCGTAHDYVTIIREEYTATTIQSRFDVKRGNDNDIVAEAHIESRYFLLGWDDSPHNMGYYLEWRYEDDAPNDENSYDDAAIDGPQGAPDWTQIAKIVNGVLGGY